MEGMVNLRKKRPRSEPDALGAGASQPQVQLVSFDPLTLYITVTDPNSMSQKSPFRPFFYSSSTIACPVSIITERPLPCTLDSLNPEPNAGVALCAGTSESLKYCNLPAITPDAYGCAHPHWCRQATKLFLQHFSLGLRD